MKKNAVLLIYFSLTLFLQPKVFSQYKEIDQVVLMCFYDLQFQPDSTNSDSRMQEEFTLLLGEHIAQSESSNSIILHEIVRETLETDNLTGFLSSMASGNIPRTRFNGRVYQNYPEGKVSVHERIAMEIYTYSFEAAVMQWDIQPHQKTINGYVSQKATTRYGGRDWEAWFTTEIPYSAGPHTFQGLPGLIVKVQDTRQHYVFTLKSISGPEIIEKITLREDNVTPVSREDYFAIRARLMENPHAFLMQSMQSTGATINFEQPAAVAGSVRDNMSKRNNPIELSID